MTNASRHVQRLRETLARLQRDRPSPSDMRHHADAFREALATDLDTPAALVALFEWVLEAERRHCEVGDEDLCAMLELLELSDLGSPQGGASASGAG
jgi:cysteinyl-tRNA synthetase